MTVALTLPQHVGAVLKLSENIAQTHITRLYLQQHRRGCSTLQIQIIILEQ